MSSLPIQIVLLFAVAFSQVFGGVSCCCLSQVFVAGAKSTSDVSSLTGVMTDNPVDVPKCPKCAMARTSSATSKAQESPSGAIGQDDHCRCPKLAASVGIQIESSTPHITTAFYVAPVYVWKLTAATKLDTPQTDVVPVRFNGHSWQSVTCVWSI